MSAKARAISAGQFSETLLDYFLILIAFFGVLTMRTAQSTYIAALLKLHDQQIEALRTHPEFEKDYLEVLLLRQRINWVISGKRSCCSPRRKGALGRRAKCR